MKFSLVATLLLEVLPIHSHPTSRKVRGGITGCETKRYIVVDEDHIEPYKPAQHRTDVVLHLLDKPSQPTCHTWRKFAWTTEHVATTRELSVYVERDLASLVGSIVKWLPVGLFVGSAAALGACTYKFFKELKQDHKNGEDGERPGYIACIVGAGLTLLGSAYPAFKTVDNYYYQKAVDSLKNQIPPVPNMDAQTARLAAAIEELHTDAAKKAAVKSSALKDGASKAIPLESVVLPDDALNLDIRPDTPLKNGASPAGIEGLKDDALKSAAVENSALTSDVLKDTALKSGASSPADVKSSKDISLKGDAAEDGALKGDFLKDTALTNDAVKDDALKSGSSSPAAIKNFKDSTGSASSLADTKSSKSGALSIANLEKLEGAQARPKITWDVTLPDEPTKKAGHGKSNAMVDSWLLGQKDHGSSENYEFTEIHRETHFSNGDYEELTLHHPFETHFKSGDFEELTHHHPFPRGEPPTISRAEQPDVGNPGPEAALLASDMLLHHVYTDEPVSGSDIVRSNRSNPLHVYHNGRYDHMTQGQPVKMWSESRADTNRLRIHTLVDFSYEQSPDSSIDIPSGMYYGYDLYEPEESDEGSGNDDSDDFFLAGLTMMTEYQDNDWRSMCVCQQRRGSRRTTGVLQYVWKDVPFDGDDACWKATCV